MSTSEPQSDHGPSVPDAPGLAPTAARADQDGIGALLGTASTSAGSTAPGAPEGAVAVRAHLAATIATADDDRRAPDEDVPIAALTAAQRRRRAHRAAECLRRAARRNQIAALVSLLGDDAERTLEVVRARLREAGRAARPALRRALRDESSAVRGRARALLLEQERERAFRRLLAFATGPTIDLERGLMLLARHHDPRFDGRAVAARLDVLAAEVRARTLHMEDPLDRGQALADYLGRELGYGGSTGDFHHPDNIHLPRVLESKRGMPLALSAIYVFVARRAGIRATLVPVPGVVMVRLHGRDRARIVDPYNRGRVRTERDLKEQLVKGGFPPRSSYFQDGDDLLLFKRQVANLARSAQLRGLGRDRRDLRTLEAVLDARGTPRRPRPA